MEYYKELLEENRAKRECSGWYTTEKTVKDI